MVTRGRRARPFATAKFLVTLGDLVTSGRGSHRGIPPASGRPCHPTLSRRFLPSAYTVSQEKIACKQAIVLGVVYALCQARIFQPFFPAADAISSADRASTSGARSGPVHQQRSPVLPPIVSTIRPETLVRW